MQRRLADSYKGGPGKGGRRHRTTGTKGLCHGKRRIVPQDVGWGLFQMRRTGEGLEKVERST